MNLQNRYDDSMLSVMASPYIYIWIPYSRMMDYRKYDHAYHFSFILHKLIWSDISDRGSG